MTTKATPAGATTTDTESTELQQALDTAQSAATQAEQLVSALQHEQGELPAQLDRAIRAGDVGEIVRLRSRKDALAFELKAAEIAKLQRRLALLEAKGPVLEQQRLQAYAPVAVALAELKQLEAQLDAARKACGQLQQGGQAIDWQIVSLDMERNQLNSELEGALREMNKAVYAGDSTDMPQLPAVYERRDDVPVPAPLQPSPPVYWRPGDVPQVPTKVPR